MRDSLDIVGDVIKLCAIVFCATFLLSLGFFILNYVSYGCAGYVCRTGIVALYSALAVVGVVMLSVELDDIINS